MPQVSVIVLTYNPDTKKLRQTLRAIAGQKDVELEVVISDDGSSKKDFSFLPEYMQTLGLSRYKLLTPEQNGGTVQNCLNGVTAATGEYVFLTSPGDFLYDDFVLRDLYDFAKKHDTPLCFGNAVFYAGTKDGVRLTREFGVPGCPHLYTPGTSAKKLKTAFFGGNWVIGASYFRSRELAQTYFERIASHCTYMEDTTSTAFALAEGHPLCYLDRNVVWYEDGTGVSTGASEKWAKLLRKDLVGGLSELKLAYPKDPYIDLAYRNATVADRKKRLLGNLFRHPHLMFRLWKMRKMPKSPVQCTAGDLSRLQLLLTE